MNNSPLYDLQLQQRRPMRLRERPLIVMDCLRHGVALRDTSGRLAFFARDTLSEEQIDQLRVWAVKWFGPPL